MLVLGGCKAKGKVGAAGSRDKSTFEEAMCNETSSKKKLGMKGFKEAGAWTIVEEALANLSSEAVGVNHAALSCGIRGR